MTVSYYLTFKFHNVKLMAHVEYLFKTVCLYSLTRIKKCGNVGRIEGRVQYTKFRNGWEDNIKTETGYA